MLPDRLLRMNAPMGATALLLVAAFSGCSGKIATTNESQHLCVDDPPARSVRSPVYRFVDRSLRQAATWNHGNGSSAPMVGTPPSRLATTTLPTATIDDDTRFVLMTPRRATVLYQNKFSVPVSLTHTFSLVIKTPLPYATRLLVLPRIEIHRHWKQLPSQLVDLPPNATDIDLELLFPAAAKRQTVNVHVNTIWADWNDIVTYETPDLHIPTGASIDFATGVLHEQWESAGVEFRLQACRKADCRTLFTEILDARQAGNNHWSNHRVPLDDIEGDGWRFVFRTQLEGESTGSRLFPVWANPTVYVPTTIAAGNPNVILLSIDTLRADVLMNYGERDNTAPFMHRTFGNNGTVFEQCTAASSSTGPSHMTMFSGLQPSVHGVTTGIESLSTRLNTVPEILRDISLETGAVTEDGWLSINYGFGRGFNVYVENKSSNITSPDGQVDATFERAATWLRRHGDTHFFLFLHTFQVHNPYAPPDLYKSLFLRDKDGGDLPPGQAIAAHEKMLYKQELRYTDDELTRLFDVLAELGLDKNTVFILVSDHGEAFGEHGYYGHGAHLYQEVTHVPFMMMGPCIARGHRPVQPIGHIDLAPTLLDLFSAKPPYPLPGNSLLALAQGRERNSALDDANYYTESWSPMEAIGPHQFTPFEAPAFAVRVGDKKLSRYLDDGDFRYEFFQLDEDPLEKHDLWHERSIELEGLVADLGRYRWKTARIRRILETRHGGAAQPGSASDDRRVLLDPTQQEKLRALGYLQ